MSYSFKWYFLRWFVSVAELGVGLIGTLTLGFYSPAWVLFVESWFLDCDEQLRENSCKKQ